MNLSTETIYKAFISKVFTLLSIKVQIILDFAKCKILNATVRSHNSNVTSLIGMLKKRSCVFERKYFENGYY